MLTSKDVLERTGISRATLNNYIATGLLPRPEVLPPQPDDGGAPRIGYFPESAVQRVLDIQRLKREGWSMARISAHLARGGALPEPEGAPASGPASRPVAAPALPDVAPVRRTEPELRTTPVATGAAWSGLRSAVAAAPALPELQVPAWLLDRHGGLAWSNEAARRPGGPLAGVTAPATGARLLAALQAWAAPEPGAREVVLALHLALAAELGQAADLLLAQLEPATRERLQQQPPHLTLEHPVTVLRLALGGVPHLLQALRSEGGALLQVVPAPLAQEAAAAPLPPPQLTQVAVLAAGLQDAAGLWLQLPAREYFELVNEVWLALDAIFARHGGRHGRHPGDGMLCYFLPGHGPADGYLWNALSAARQVRDAMRHLSSRWRVRKGWDIELCMNTGVAEGLEWMGVLRPTQPQELTVLGDAVDHARQLSALARGGAVWITRNLVGKLDGTQRERLSYGVPRREPGGGEARVLSSFARLQDLVAAHGLPGAAVPAALEQLPVTELVDMDMAAPASAGPDDNTRPAGA